LGGQSAALEVFLQRRNQRIGHGLRLVVTRS
jgi:hypothetical protein